jgi:uncharacterized repeat protein (TIGR01451 family)
MPAERKTNHSGGLTAAGLIAVTAATLLTMAWAIFPTPAAATHVSPQFKAGNPSCEDLGYDFGFKIEPVTGGEHSGGLGSVTLTLGSGNTFSWTSTFGIDAVIVKGGPNANLYAYDPPSEAFSDSGLHAPDSPSGGFAGLSHLEFCYDEDEANLNITKTASSTQVSEGGSFSYTITVENTGDAPATNVVVTDDLDNNLTGVSVSASQGTCDPVGAGNMIECELGTIAGGASATVTINATAPQLPLTEGGPCEISIANTASVDSTETDKVSDDAPLVTVTGTGCESGGGGGGGGGTTTTTTTTTAPPGIAPTTIHKSTTPADEVLPTTVTPGGTAFTGVEDVVPIGALALMLMTSGTGLLWAGARRRRQDGSEDED